MATLITNTLISLTAIEGTDCLGDSRTVINNNITTIGASISSLTLNSTTLSTTVINLNTSISTLSTDVSSTRTSFNTNNIGASATLTTYVSALSVFTPTGSYIGFIPIYI